MANPSLKPLRAEDFDYWKAQHLLNRAGFGGTPGQVRAMANLGLKGAVDYIVDFDAIEDDPIEADEFDRNIMRPATDEERGEFRMARQKQDEVALEKLRQERQERQRADRTQIRRVQEWWLKRMIESPRPLQEKMTLFWHGHFATGYRKIEDSYHMFLQNQLFRAQAAGNFRELTRRIVRDPAMIRYLDNHLNRRQAPNENLARELMELFTLGEGHIYTEQDIKEGARALTGYAYVDDDFRFVRRMHDDGPKSILGRTGNFDGDDFVRIIFEHDIPSQYMCWKLYRYFVNDLPGEPDKDAQGFILKLASELRKKDYDLKPVLRTLFLSAHFYDEANIASQIKSPVQLVVQAIRSLRTPARELGTLISALDLMGQNIMFPPSVKGWDGGRAWINTSTVYVRQNTMVYLLTGRRADRYRQRADGAVFDAAHLVEHLDTSGNGISTINVADAVNHLLRFNFGREPHPDRVEAVLNFVEANGGRLSRDVLLGILSLITAMPEYQLC